VAKYRYLFLLPMLIAQCGIAADITISGKVVASPCVVDATSFNQPVDLGQDDAHNLNQPGAGSQWQPVQLSLNNCPATTTYSTANFSGDAAVGYSDGYKNQGTAANVVLQLASADHSTLYGSGSAMTLPISPSTRSATFLLAARMYAPFSSAQSGTFKSTVNVTFTYQ
jgi:minor fimbrial subunit